jgi:hypothetical protein
MNYELWIRVMIYELVNTATYYLLMRIKGSN